MNFEIDARVVIEKYQEQLRQTTHNCILLQAQVEQLQNALAQQELAQHNGQGETGPKTEVMTVPDTPASAS